VAEVRTPPKKLADLNPKWFTEHASGRTGYGVEFDCPCGQGAACEWGGRIHVPFANPLDGGPPGRWGSTKWQRTGETFENLSLTPSIHAVGHWHGWLTNGVLTSC
jgi:hypothetical protein